MIKNFIILRMYRVLRVKFTILKASIKEKKNDKSENVTNFSDFDTNILVRLYYKMPDGKEKEIELVKTLLK